MGDIDDIEACIPRLRRYARALTGDRFSADDLVQETLERGWRRLHLWRRGTNISGWLFTIMHNLHVNQVRGSHGKRHVALDETLELPLNSGRDDWLEARDLAVAIRKLSDEQREVVLLIGLEQMTYAEVAKTLGVPIGTVMSRLCRAREILRGLLKKEAGPHSLKVVK